MWKYLRMGFALHLLVLPALYGQITLTSPQEWQVFQRHTQREGKVEISGHAETAADAVEVHLSGTAASAPLQDRWVRLKFQPASGNFHRSLRVPAGGFYTVEVRLLRSHVVVATTSVPHVGVGEVFVISGQSNSTNWGEQQQTTQTKMVSSFSGTSWSLADDPQPGTQDNSTKGSFLPPFGDALVRRYHVPIGIVSVGRGATSIRQWLPAGERVDVLPATSKFIVHDPQKGLVCDGTLFNTMIQRIRQLGPHGFRALLWDQGQSDSSLAPEHTISGERFEAMTALVIRRSRKAAGWNFPWITAVGTYMNPQHPSDPSIQRAQRNIWKKGFAIEGPDTDLLTGVYRGKNGMGVHYNDMGLKAVGAAWAQKVEAYIDTQLKTAP